MSSNPLFLRPEFAKLVRSTQVALPVEEDVLGALAYGLRLTGTELIAMLDAAVAEGLLRGIWLEPNPRVRGTVETLVQGDAVRNVVSRWTVTGGAVAPAFLQVGASVPGSLSHAKIGLPIPLGQPPESLLEPTRDRTYLARQESVEPRAFTPTESALLSALTRVVPTASGASPWSLLGAVASAPPEQARSAVKRLLMDRQVRRFALRWDVAALGWRGCGLARWDFREVGLASQAAEALAALSGTGDVMVRAAEAGGEELVALFLSREPGPAEAAAQQIAAQWRRPLAEWRPLEIH